MLSLVAAMGLVPAMLLILHISNCNIAAILSLGFRKLKFSNTKNPFMLSYGAVTMVKEGDWILNEI